MVRARLRVLMALVGLPFLAILGRLYSLQLVPSSHEEYQRLAQHRLRTLTSPRRGRILARDGTGIVNNQPIYQLLFNYGRLNPREEPLAILVEELQKSAQFPGKEDVERHLLELADPEALAHTGDADSDDAGSGGADSGGEDGSRAAEWLLLVENVDPRVAERLRRRWKGCPGPGTFEARPAPDGRSFSVWFDRERAVQMELVLKRIQGVVGGAPAAGLSGRVASVLADIEKRVANEVKRDDDEGISTDRVLRKAREVRAYYHNRQGWLLLQDVPLGAVTEIEYRPWRFPGIECADAVRREYPLKEACGTLTGYLRRLDSSPGDERAFEERGQLLDPDDFETIDTFRTARVGGARRTDWIGEGGLEEFYDAELRGLHGMSIASCDRKGRPCGVLDDLPPENGRDIRTTIDPELQKLLYAALEQAVKPLGGLTGGTSGSAVVMEVESGAILASVGFPGVDPGRMRDSGYHEELEGRWGAQTRSWFLDRPSSLPIYPGSVFKIVVAAAAMESAKSWEGEFSADRRYPCHHRFDLIPSLTCDSLHGHTPTQDVNLAEALQYSCNVYFYYLGWKHLGAGILQPWAYNFGYGRPPGIDLPEIPSQSGMLKPAEKAREPWQACHYAIGQGFVEGTPLQVLRSVAAIAAGGKCLPRPHLVRPSPPDTLKLVNPRTVETIREGLWRAGHAPEGTASHDKLRLNRYNAAYKTGTAEVKSGEPPIHNGWLVGFAPFEKPRIAFVAVVERTPLHGAEAAGPIVEKLLAHLAAKEPTVYLLGKKEGK